MPPRRGDVHPALGPAVQARSDPIEDIHLIVTPPSGRTRSTPPAVPGPDDRNITASSGRDLPRAWWPERKEEKADSSSRTFRRMRRLQASQRAADEIGRPCVVFRVRRPARHPTSVIPVDARTSAGAHLARIGSCPPAAPDRGWIASARCFSIPKDLASSSASRSAILALPWIAPRLRPRRPTY